MQVVGHLRHRVHGELPGLRVPLRERGVELDLAVRELGALVVALEHQVGGRQARIDVAEVLLDRALDVARPVVVQQHGALGARRVGIEVGRQRVDLDHHRRQRSLGRALVVGGHRVERLAAVAHAAARERPLVLRDRDHAVGRGEVLAGDDGAHARQRQRGRGVDAADDAVRDGAAPDAADERAGAGQVGGVARAAADLLDAIDQRPAFAHRVRGRGRLARRQRFVRALHAARSAAAACTASTIFT